jgi:glycosyltransferase involved in cell wall biosynthesis
MNGIAPEHQHSQAMWPVSPHPLFSVIVASYNNGSYLDEMIESVCGQSWPHWELIIAEDCSTDESSTILEKWSNHPQIRVIAHDQNRGAGAAFATAASYATGEIIGMLGADDALMPNALARMVRAHQDHPEASLINSLAIGCDAELRPLGPVSYCRNIAPTEELIFNLVISSFATFKREAYERTSGFNPDFKRAVDHDIYLKLDEVGQLVGIDEFLYLYRQHAGGISQGESGVLAQQFSYQARIDAYRRRLGTPKKNYSRKEARMLLDTWFLREAYSKRWVQSKECNGILSQALRANHRLLLHVDFWSIFLRNNFIGL